MTNNLLGVSQKFIRRCRLIEDQFVQLDNPDAQLYCILRFYSEWERFVEDVIFVSAVRRPITGSGVRLDVAAEVLVRGSFRDALAWSCAPRNGRRPKVIYWGDASRVVPIVSRMGLSNAQSVVGSLGASNSCADDLRKLRNFVAHRNPDTWEKASEVCSIGSVGDVSNYLGEYVPGGARRFSAWCRNLEILAVAAAS